MAKIIDFKKNEPIGKQVLEDIITTLKELDPENVSSIIVSIGLQNDDGRGTFLLVRNLDFYDVGYLESQLSMIKLELLDQHTLNSTDETADDFLDHFAPKDPEDDK